MKKNAFIGNFLFLTQKSIKNNYFREFIFFLRRFIIILLISFVKIGDGGQITLINACIIIIILGAIFAFQLKQKPFLTKELNYLDFLSNVIIIMTIYGGLFASISSNMVISSLVMLFLLIFNIYFLCIFLKEYTIMFLIVKKHQNKKSFLTELGNKYMQKCKIK